MTEAQLSHDPLVVQYVDIINLKPAEYNPRKWSEDATTQLKESLTRFGLVDPFVVNNAPGRENVVIGGHFRLKVAQEIGFTQAPVVYITIPDIEREKELNLRLNKNLGDWDWSLLKDFAPDMLSDVGFSSKELDTIFDVDMETPEQFDLQKELQKLDIQKVEMQPREIYKLGDSRLMIGDSTQEGDVLALFGEERADLCLTDPPYILDYLHGKRHGKPTTGFGAKKNRRYLEVESLPENFTELWMSNVAKIQQPNFSIIVYENWKNLRTIWNEMEKYWKVQNMIIWHIPNRHQGFAAKRKFFSKYDFALAGASSDKDVEFNTEPEEDGLQEEYENALFATSGKAYWESYEKGKKFQPTDFIEHNCDDEKQSGQNIIFGTKPIEILIPYIKVLTTRDGLIFEPFGGSGSTLIAATKLKRRCFIMEKSPVYAEVIRKRWEKLTGLTAEKIGG